jgi:hypothetical protein
MQGERSSRRRFKKWKKNELLARPQFRTELLCLRLARLIEKGLGKEKMG